MTFNLPTDFEIERAILENSIPDAWQHDAQIMSRMQSYRAAQQQFLDKNPFEDFYSKLTHQVSSNNNKVISLSSKRQQIMKWSSIVLAIAAMLVVAIKIGGIPGIDKQADSYIGLKGNLDFGFYYQKPDGQAMLGESGLTLNAGDKIRFYYTSDAPAYLMIVGRESSSGKLSLYYASDSEQALAIQSGNNQILANTFILDNYKGTETFTALFANHAFSFSDAQAALDKNNSKIKQLSFIIRK